MRYRERERGMKQKEKGVRGRKHAPTEYIEREKRW